MDKPMAMAMMKKEFKVTKTIPRIIGLAGKKGSGKTTTAHYLVERYGFKELCFATPVKQITSIIYGFDYNILLGDTPKKRAIRSTVRDPIYGKTGVEAMQYLGTDLFRDRMDKDIWVNILKRECFKDDTPKVISDARFPNEIEFIRNMGGEIWELVDCTESDDVTATTTHASETSYHQALLANDPRIYNSKVSLEELYASIDEVLVRKI